MEHNWQIFKKADITPYNKALNKARNTAAGSAALGRVSAGEIGWTAAGATGGGLLGYMLARLSSRRSRGRDLAYILLGAATGGVGTQAALNMSDKEFKGTLREKMRLSRVVPELALPAGTGSVVEGTARSFDRKRMGQSIGGVGTIGGGILGTVKGVGTSVPGLKKHLFVDFNPDAQAQVKLDNFIEQNKSTFDNSFGRLVEPGGRDVMSLNLAQGTDGSIIQRINRRMKNDQINRAMTGKLHIFTDEKGIQRAKLLPPDNLKDWSKAQGKNALSLLTNAAAYAALGSGMEYIARTAAANLPTSRSKIDRKALEAMYRDIGTRSRIAGD